MTAPSFSETRRNVLIVAVENRLLVPALLVSGVYRMAADDGVKTAEAKTEFNTAVNDMIKSGYLKQSIATGKVTITTAGRAQLTEWAGRAY